VNPFAAADLPTLDALSGGHRWLATTGPQRSERALFIPVDPRMGVPGRPQSGSNQATIVTGINVPQRIGQHYGPKPNLVTRDILDADNLFKQIIRSGKSAALLEAYPPRWHRVLNNGKMLPASYQYAVKAAGLPFMTVDDLRAGRALSGDWTGEGWHANLGFDDTPLYEAYDAGRKLVQLSRAYDFAFFSHWLTDVAGHRGTLEEGAALLQTFDAVMRGVLDEWHDEEGLVIVTSDHGNLEDISHGKHTTNDVPVVLIGDGKDAFADGLHDLTGLAPRIARLLELD
jgi:predicted AlkP superfamily pyrophosphatase or phosphodiesterase